jgi:hypothetical protein
MASFRCWLRLLSFAVVLLETKGIADTPRAADLKTFAGREESARPPGQPANAAPVPSGEKSLGTPSPLSLDMLKLPAGAVLVVCEQAREALRLVPQMIVLTPQAYQRLMDQLEQLKRQTEVDKPDNPSSCNLTGHVEGDWVYFRAQFGFKTERARSSINLGCLGALPTAATLDGNQAALGLGEDGYVLRVDSPGVHQATLDLQLRLDSRRGSKGADRVIDLNLPHAAIMTLERLDLPPAVPEVRIGSRSFRTTQVDAQHSRLERIPLALRPLNVAWKGPAAKPPKSAPVRQADGRITVRVTETQVLTEVELNLQVLSGEAEEWRLRLPPLPPDALDVKTPPQDQQRIKEIEPPGEKQDSVLTIRLNEPSAETLHLILHIRQPRPSGGLALGPFAVLDTLVQKGEIEIHAPAHLRLRWQAAGELSQKDVGKDQRGQNVLVFEYWNMSNSAQPLRTVPPLLTLLVEAIKGAVETRVIQSLRLEGDAEQAHWQASTRIEVTPMRTAVDSLEIALPANYEYDQTAGAMPSQIVEDVILDRSKQTAQIKLAQSQIRPFTLTLAGCYPVPTGELETSLEFVRPLNWSVQHGVSNERQSTPILDRGCQVNVALSESFEFVARPFRSRAEDGVRNVSHSVLPLPPKSGTRDYAWQGERTPAQIDLAWRVHRPELQVDALVDVTLAGQHALVRQRLRYQLGPTSRSHLLLRVPAEIQQSLRILEGGIRDPEQSRTPGEWAVSIPTVAGKEQTLTLEYSFPLPGLTSKIRGQPPVPSQNPARRITVPLVKPLHATRGETKVRIWCDSGEQPGLAGGSWTELATEIVPDQDRLPLLVLRGSHDSKLLLRLTEPTVAPLAAAVVERILVRASVGEKGMQAYRLRFLLSKLSARHLDLELPVLLSTSDLDVRLDGKRVLLHIVDESGKEMEIGKVMRLRVDPELYHQPVLLEVSYQADAGRMEGNGPLQSTLRPPTLRGAILLGRARWQVDLPGGWLPLSTRGAATVEQTWGWWGWLLAPRPAWNNAELAQWLGQPERPEAVEDTEPGLVCWQSALGPLILVQVPQRGWLLACSLTILTLGLGLFLAPLSRYLFWTGVVILSTVVTASGVYSPAALPAIAYGCEPGALVLLVAIAAQWTLHRRYRRQVAFMPGFTRVKNGSSLIRRGNSNRPHDPSTIDEPRERASLIEPGAQAGSGGHSSLGGEERNG